MRTKLIIVLCGIGLFGCDEETTADAGVDSGVMTRPDAGGMDSGTDAGPTDPCAADESNAATTVGCNGPLYGTTPSDNEIDGPCTPDGVDGPGTCMILPGLEAFCFEDEMDPSMGICVYICPMVSDYVSTGSCPSGTRCFNLTDESYCFRDCNTAADCFAGELCDADQSCVLPEPDMDGGMSDGGTSDGGTFDGATSDGGTSDGGTSEGGTSDGGTSEGGTSDGGMADAAMTSDGGAPADAAVPADGGGATDGGAPADASTPDGG